MTFSLLDLVQLLAAYHCAGLVMALLRAPRLRGLAILCGTFSLHMAFNLAVGLGVAGPQFDITSAFGLVYGPAFFLFVRGLVFEERAWRWHDALHGVPALIIAIWQPEPPIPYFFGLPSLVIYIALAILALRRHRHLRVELRSDDRAISLNWVEQALIGFAALAVLDIAREIAGYAAQGLPDDLALAVIIGCVVILMTRMTLAARAHDAQHGALPDLELAGAGGEASQHAETFARITALLETEEAWREPRLSLADLARRLHLNARDVSRAINLTGGSSFSRFINAYRVDALDRLMADPAHHGRTIMELAYEVGFNSKSAFNRTYREMTGRTPTEAFAAAKSR